MSATPKDHKQIPDSGVPKSRGVTGASRSMNQRISDMTNDNLTYIIASDPTSEVGSTEQLLYSVETINKEIREGRIESKDLVVGSLDVTALYASIDTRKAVKLTRDRAIMSSCTWEGVDIRWALIYLAFP